jgi:hypothetical protein
LGKETAIQTGDIIGIFDIEKTSTGHITRDFLRNAEKNLLITNVSEKLPKSFVVTQGRAETRVYISQISVMTLQKRIETKNTVPERECSTSEDRLLSAGGKGENT